MNLKDLEQKSVDELMQEFADNKDELFIKIVNADSILGLSDKEKSFYIARYKGMSDAEIAEAIGMNYNTVRSHQFLLRKKVLEAKLTLLLWNLSMADSEQKQINVSKKIEKPRPDERLPGLDKNGRVYGFYTKAQLHDKLKPIHHASVIILVAQRGADGVMRFLVCTKSSKMLTISGMDAIGKTYIDVMGGHVEELDGEVTIGKELPKSAYFKAAVREFLEEVNVKSSKPLVLKPENLVYLYTDEGDRPLYPDLYNHETSQVFVARLPAMPQKNILTRDAWSDSFGALHKWRFPSQFLTFDELITLADGGKDNVFLMDAAQRVVERLSEDPQLKEKLFELLETTEPIY